MLIEDSLSITIACVIMVLIGFIWTINILRIVFADNVDKITKIAFNGLKWTFYINIINVGDKLLQKLYWLNN